LWTRSSSRDKTAALHGKERLRARYWGAVSEENVEVVRRAWGGLSQPRQRHVNGGDEMDTRTAHLGLYEGFAEMEAGHLLAELHTGRFTGIGFGLVAVAESREPVMSMGGVRTVPDALLAEVEPTRSDLLILPGAEMWDAGGGEAFAAAAGRFL